MNDVRVFLSFDLDHDRELGDRLAGQSRRTGSGFEITARSEPLPDEAPRRRIASSDEVGSA